MSRIPTPLINTPQTVNVVTQQVIQDRNISSMEDALRGIPGITFNAGEGGQQGDSPIIRGFVARGDIFRDGIRDPGWYTRDLFSADRVEVYKGPSAFAFGRGSTGGAINTRLEAADRPDLSRVAASPPSTPRGVRAEVDAGGKIGNVSARIAAMWQDIDTPDRDHVGTKRWGVAPSVSVDVTDKTKVTLSYVYQGEDSVPDYGHPYLPAPAYNAGTGALTNSGYFGNGKATPPVPIPRNNWFGVVGGSLNDRVLTDTHILTGKIEHEFTNNVKVTNTTRYVSVDRLARPTAPRSLFQANNTSAVTPGYPVELMTIGRQHFMTETDNALLINQTDLSAKFNTFGLRHTVAAGLEFAKEDRFQQRARGTAPTGDASNLCAPTHLICRTSLYYPVDTSFGGVFNGWNTPLVTEAKTVAVVCLGPDQDQRLLRDHGLGPPRLLQDGVRRYRQCDALRPAPRARRQHDQLSRRRHLPPDEELQHLCGPRRFLQSVGGTGTLSSATNNAASAMLAPEKNNTIEVGAQGRRLEPAAQPDGRGVPDRKGKPAHSERSDADDTGARARRHRRGWMASKWASAGTHHRRVERDGGLFLSRLRDRQDDQPGRARPRTAEHAAA